MIPAMEIFFAAILGILGFIFLYFKFVRQKTQESDETESNSGDDSFADITPGVEAIENMFGLKQSKDPDRNHCDALDRKRCFNILLLGESGTGKSTTINALANYVRFDSFDDAMQAKDFTQLIPSKFTLPNPLTGKPFVIEFGGQDSNERFSPGHSSTQSPRGYKFMFADQQDPICLIDTPGVGDTGGTDLDRRNFDRIFRYLKSEIDQLNAILILMKSTDTRQHSFFRYCITELLTHLHKSACRNIVFCFTFSRSSCYGPGDAYSVIETFLEQELRDVPLKLRPQVNCFFIDNEAFRFLVAQKSGYPFTAKQAAAHSESWNESAQQVAKMMSHIVGLPAHDLRQTISLNRARKCILKLAEPMARLQGNINHNIEQLEQEERRLATSKLTAEELAQTLHLEVDDLEGTQLDKPTTVCTSDCCTDVVKFQGQTKINYRTKCHIDCGLTNLETGRVGHPILQKCLAMDDTLMCMHSYNSSNRIGEGCGCPWEKHMHIQQEYHRVKRTIVDRNKEREIESTQTAIDRISKYMDELRTLIAEYRSEFSTIGDVCSRFACVLIEHSNTPYNRYFEPYVQLLIDEERRKCASVPGYSRVALDGLQKMLDTHRSNVEILRDAIERKTSEPIALSEVERLRESLFDLPHNGAQLRQMMNAMNIDQDHNPNQNLNQDQDRLSAVKMTMVPHVNFGWRRNEKHANKYKKKLIKKTFNLFNKIFYPNSPLLNDIAKSGATDGAREDGIDVGAGIGARSDARADNVAMTSGH